MPARRRAPEGCWLSKIIFPKPAFTIILELINQQQNVKLFLREPLVPVNPLLVPKAFCHRLVVFRALRTPCAAWSSPATNSASSTISWPRASSPTPIAFCKNLYGSLLYFSHAADFRSRISKSFSGTDPRRTISHFRLASAMEIALQKTCVVKVKPDLNVIPTQFRRPASRGLGSNDSVTAGQSSSKAGIVSSRIARPRPPEFALKLSLFARQRRRDC